ncbi:hypothetical protein GBA52_005203 [Prunus armeniaca]|nr:hypothetical protein GBA52_005203 [Prunus armeniaca]
MDDKLVDAQKDHQGQDDSLHRLSKERELSRNGTLKSSGSKLKRLVTWSNPQHALISNVKCSQISKCCTKSSLFPSALGLDRRIPKHILSLDEKFRRRCMELIHISASKATRCSAVVNLSSTKIGALPESLNVAKVRSGDTCNSTRFVFECPLAAGGGSVVIGPAGQWIVGTVMGSKSMVNILKSPLFHQFGPLSSNTDLTRINTNDVKGSICYDFTESPGGLSFSSSPVLEKETPNKGSHKNGSDTGHKRFVSLCSTNSACSDQSSASALATVSQGMLQCTWKGGNPHFVFSTDQKREVYVANLWKVESEEDKTLDYVYLFHSGKGGQKDHEIRDGESQLVGKMKVNNLVSLCSNNSKIMETEFVLFGGVIEMHTSSHNLRKSKGLSKKVAEVFRSGHSSKQKTSSKLSGPISKLESSSQESCLDTGNNQDALGLPNLLEDHLPPNFELAAIVVKDHLPDDRKEEAGGWGLKFLKKVGVKKTATVEASVPIECCRNNGDCSTSMDVLIPAGLHGGPRTRNGGVSSLTERWRSGGHCDCGGWDLGCPLTVLQTKSSKEDIFPQSDTQGECKSFDLNRKGSEHGPPTFRMLNVHDGLYFKKEAPSYDKTEAVELPTQRVYTRQQKKQALYLSKSCSDATPSRHAHPSDDDLLSDSSSENNQPPLRKYSMKQQEASSILESEGVKSKNKEAQTEDAEHPTKRLCTRQQRKQALSQSKSSLETTPSRSAHPNDVELLSDSSCDDPQPPLSKYSLKHQEEEARIRESVGVKSKNKKALSYDKTEDVELPTKRLCTSQRKKQAVSLSKSSLEKTPSRSAHSNDNLFSDSSSEELQTLSRRTVLRHQEEEVLIHESKGVKSENKEVPSYDKIEVDAFSTKKLYTIQQEKKSRPFSKSCLETAPSRKAHQNDEDMFSDSEESEECVPLLRTNRRNHEEGALVIWKNLDPVHSCNPGVAENLNVILLHDSSYYDGCNADDGEDSSGLLEVEPLNVDNRDSVSDLSQMDVSSSPPTGEVKIPLIGTSSPQHDFHLPNCDAAVEVVEGRCIKSYRNGESHLAIETNSTVDKKTRLRDSPDLKISNAQDVLARKDDYQRDNCGAPSFPSEVFVFQNLIKIVPHIPKHIVFSGFECLNHLIGFTTEDIEKICGESGKRLKVLQGLQSSKLCKVEAAQNHHSSLGVVKSCVYIDDITRGEERVKISLEDGRNVEDLPTFFYIPQNLVYKNAYVKFSLDRISDKGCCPHCYGDCLASPIPCICAIETRGGFAYTPGGLVKDKFLEDCISMKQEPKEHNYVYCKKCPLESSKNRKSPVACKGHLFRKFMKECWSKCGCNMNCGNRIVQQGITVKLQVFLTPEGKGWGLRTLEDLPRGAFVCEYVGEIVTNTELYERNMHSVGKKHTCPVLLDADWGSEGMPHTSTQTYKSHLSPLPSTHINIFLIVNFIICRRVICALLYKFQVIVFSGVVCDYGIDFDDHDHPVKAFQCLCGSPFCRGGNL